VAFVDATAGAGKTDVDIGVPTYDIGGVLDTNKEKYRGKFFNFQQPVAGWGQQIQLNGSIFSAILRTIRRFLPNYQKLPSRKRKNERHVFRPIP
jgi:hypothetical protein